MTTDPNIEMLQNVHTARGEFYSFLSKLFCNVPDDNLYSLLMEMSPKLKTLAENTDNNNLKTGVQGIVDFLNKRNALSGKELSDFDLDTSRHYTSMFCLTSSIPTDESVYTSVEHRPREESYDKMVALFSKYGMKKTNDIPENEDFISYELLFMSRLAYACVKLLENGDEENYGLLIKEQLDFHTNHFDKWVYTFFHNVINYNKIEGERLYKYFGHLGKGFLEEDKLSLEEFAL